MNYAGKHCYSWVNAIVHAYLHGKRLLMKLVGLWSPHDSRGGGAPHPPWEKAQRKVPKNFLSDFKRMPQNAFQVIFFQQNNKNR